MTNDEKEFSAPPSVPATVGENANWDPDDKSYTTEKPQTPDTMEAWGAEEITTTDIRFEGKILQALHKHPIIGTVGVVILGGVLAGAAAMVLRSGKCAIAGLVR